MRRPHKNLNSINELKHRYLGGMLKTWTRSHAADGSILKPSAYNQKCIFLLSTKLW